MPQKIMQIGMELKDKLSGDLKRAYGNIQGFKARAVRAFKSIGRAVFSVKGAIIGLGGYAVLRGIKNMITSTAELADRYQKLSIELGISTEALSVLRWAGEQSGVSFGSLTTALEQATRRMEEFKQRGTGGIDKVVHLLGDEIIYAINAGQSLEGLLPKISDRLKSLSTAAERAYLSYNLFGRSGLEAGNKLLAIGSEGLERFRKEAEHLGIVIDQKTADAAANFNDQVNRLYKLLEGLKIKIIGPLLPMLTDFAFRVQVVASEFDIVTNKIKVAWAELKNFGSVLHFLYDPKGWTDDFWEGVGNIPSSLFKERETKRSPFQGRPVSGSELQGSIPPWMMGQGEETSGAIEKATKHLSQFSTIQKESLNVHDKLASKMPQFWKSYVSSVDTAAKVVTRVLGTALYALEDAMVAIVLRTKSVKEAFQDMAKAVVAEIVKIITRLIVSYAIQSATESLNLYTGGPARVAGANAAMASAIAAATAASNAVSLAEGGIVTGPRSGFPVIMHGKERVKVEPLGKEDTGVVHNHNYFIYATDAQSFDRQWFRAFQQKKDIVASEISRKYQRNPNLNMAAS